jgi:hypothetical protein
MAGKGKVKPMPRMYRRMKAIEGASVAWRIVTFQIFLMQSQSYGDFF